MQKISPTTYALLGMLAVRPWTGYELTHQIRRSLRYVWSSSEGHLYREQKRLVTLGWATVEKETIGARSRRRYEITPLGRDALKKWLGSQPEEPHFEIEGVLRLFYADHGSASDLAASMAASSEAARVMLTEMVGTVREYLEEGGPLSMLDQGIGGPGQRRLVYKGRPQYPERLHSVALAIDITTRLLAELETFFTSAATDTKKWKDTTSSSLTPSTRSRLEAIASRYPGIGG